MRHLFQKSFSLIAKISFLVFKFVNGLVEEKLDEDPMQFHSIIEAVGGFAVIPSLLPVCTRILFDKFASVSQRAQSPNLDVYAGIYVTALIKVFEAADGGAEETANKALLRLLEIAACTDSSSGCVFVADGILKSLKKLAVVLTTLVSERYIFCCLNYFSDRASILDSHIIPFFSSSVVNRTRSRIVLLSSIFAACPANQTSTVDGAFVDELMRLALENSEDELALASISKLVASLLNKCQDGLSLY